MSSLPPPPLAPPCCPEEYGVGGIGKAMAAGVIYCRLGKDKDLLDVLKVDDKCLAKGPDPKEGYEELSESLVCYTGGHAWSLKRLRSFLNGKSKDQWHETLEKLVRLDYPGDMALLRKIRLLQHFRSISGLEIINPPETEVYTSGYTAELCICIVDGITSRFKLFLLPKKVIKLVEQKCRAHRKETQKPEEVLANMKEVRH
ncbi:hypothetical protein NL676_000561 [Syzygium grande]|nr:hypothetical protein NL676_000561 [Syzygium grande]